MTRVEESTLRLRGRFFLGKICEKVKFLVYHKIEKTHLQGPKNLRKNILNGLETNLDKNLTLEKKKSPNLPNFLPNPEIFDIFEISKLV